ncbi:M3 family metallopeptidase [Vibrio sp. M60_M31a]
MSCLGQFLENWCWEEEALAFISGHYETGEPLPKAMLDKMLAAKNFQSAMGILRQLEFGVVRLHPSHGIRPRSGRACVGNPSGSEAESGGCSCGRVGAFLAQFRAYFAGGYSAGYYSYLWAEVLSSDAFSRFEEEGIFNKDTGPKLPE